MLTLDSIERIKAATAKRGSSAVLNLGEIIALCESALDPSKPKKDIRFDFGYIVPTDFGSYRGDYSQLALGWVGGEYGKEPAGVVLVDFVAMAKAEIGATHTGWKGGDYMMRESTPVWAANDGQCPHCGIVGILDEGYMVIIQTAYCDD